MNDSIEMLISTMNTDSQSLVKKMNIQTNAIVINQTNQVKYNMFHLDKNTIQEYQFNERGIGLSRNNALLRATADICMMADDDMVYVDHYPDLVKSEYEKYPDADMILFNVRIHDEKGTQEKVDQNGKVHYFNSLRYGTVTFSFRRDSVIRHNIFFSQLFGGAKYGNGEDSIFLWDCLKANMNIRKSTKIIADVYNEESTWFKGFDEKFFLDRGALYRALSKRFYKLLIWQYAIRKRHTFPENMSVFESIQLMLRGAKTFSQ